MINKKKIIFIGIGVVTILTVAVLVILGFQGDTIPNNQQNTENGLPKPPEDNTESLKINWKKAFYSPSGSVNFVVQIENPNDNWGAENIEYTVKLLDASGEEIGVKRGSSYILPNEKKYIAELVIETKARPASAQFIMGDVLWTKLRDFVRLKLDVENPKVDEIDNDPKFKLTAVGRVANNSFFGLNDIDVVAVLFDDSGEAIDVNRTRINTVLEGEKRDAEMFWPYVISLDRIESVEIEAYSNVFENQNFLRTYSI